MKIFCRSIGRNAEFSEIEVVGNSRNEVSRKYFQTIRMNFNFILIVLGAVLFSSCSVTIPMMSNLSDQTMLLAKNKNIKANYSLVSNVPDGAITYVSVLKNGNFSSDNNSYKYVSETAFKKIWNSYFQSKFNAYSKEQMDISVTLVDLSLRQQSATSIGATLLTGNTKYNVEAVGIFRVVVDYKGEKFENQFEVTVNDCNESQEMKVGSNYYRVNQTNPTQQKSKLLESCFNKGIIQFENYLQSIMILSEEK
jgi:hypothetical protein